jgi:hypothetical protein
MSNRSSTLPVTDPTTHTVVTLIQVMHTAATMKHRPNTMLVAHSTFPTRIAVGVGAGAGAEVEVEQDIITPP